MSEPALRSGPALVAARAGVAGIALDQLTKEWILRNFALHESRYVLPVFDIVRMPATTARRSVS